MNGSSHDQVAFCCFQFKISSVAITLNVFSHFFSIYFESCRLASIIGTVPSQKKNNAVHQPQLYFKCTFDRVISPSISSAAVVSFLLGVVIARPAVGCLFAAVTSVGKERSRRWGSCEAIAFCCHATAPAGSNGAGKARGRMRF